MAPAQRRLSNERPNSAAHRRAGFVPKSEELPPGAEAHTAVVRKLANEILPWFVSSEELGKKSLYRAHTIYSWTRDVFTALTGFGLSHPLAKVITGESTDLGAALSKMPFWLFGLTGFSAGAWLILKTYVTRDDGEKKAVLARSCRKEFMSLNLKLRTALNQPNPQKALIPIQAEVMAVVDRHIAEGSWFFPGDDVLAEDIHPKVRKRVADLVAQHISNWDRPSQEGELEQHESSSDSRPGGGVGGEQE